MVGALPSRIALRSTGSASPSISRKMIPGTSVRGNDALPSRDSPDHPQRIVVVVVRPQHDLERDRHGGHHERGQQGASEGVDRPERGQEVVRQDQGRRIGRQHEQEAEPEGVGQPQGCHQRRKNGVDGRHRRSDQKAPSPGARAGTRARARPPRKRTRRRRPMRPVAGRVSARAAGPGRQAGPRAVLGFAMRVSSDGLRCGEHRPVARGRHHPIRAKPAQGLWLRGYSCSRRAARSTARGTGQLIGSNSPRPPLMRPSARRADPPRPHARRPPSETMRRASDTAPGRGS